MLFKACVLKNLLLAQGKDHITKMQFVFQNDPLSFLDCVFFHLRTLTKNNSEPRAPFKDFGEGPFENQGCPISRRQVLSVSVEGAMECQMTC